MGIGFLQPTHLLLILLIVLIVFGAGKLSQVGSALGKSVKDFKTTVSEDDGGDAVDAAPASTETRVVVRPETLRHTPERSADPLRREEI